MNLMMLLEMAAQGLGDRVAFVNGDDRLTYQQLFEAAGRTADEIRASGAKHAAVLGESSLAVPIGLFAAAWAGVPYVPLNYRLTGEELDALIERIYPAYLVTDPERIDGLSHHSSVTLTTRDDFLAKARGGSPAADSGWSMEAEDIALLLFTSGTTGAPKAAVLRQKHLVSYILTTVEFMSAGEDDAALVSVPPYHIAGMAAILSSVYAGRRVVQLPHFSAEVWLDLARREGVSNAFVVPTMLARVVEALEEQESADLPNLRSLSYGGGKMPQPIIERAMRLFPETNFANAYGLTETSSTVTILGPDDHRTAMASEVPEERRRLVSVGRPLPGVEVEIRDDEGRKLVAGERGEIYVRGEQVSGEYVGRGSQLDAEGWFPTRDAGSLDEEGYLFLEGRADDVIVRGGENLSPGEIEDVLHEHESVADVGVVGIPDEEWGEGVAAAVVLKRGKTATVEDLQAWVKAHLRSSRVPQRIQFYEELPYNETGKLLRRVIKAELVGEA